MKTQRAKKTENKVRKKDITYVSLDSKSVLAGETFQAMTATERGVYWTLILYLYANGGSVIFDSPLLSRICNCENFDEVWEKIKHSFRKKGAKIFHKMVSKELTRTVKLLQTRRQAGLKGANARWQTDNKAITNQSGCDSEAKLSNANRSEDKRRENIPSRDLNKSSQLNQAEKSSEKHDSASLKFSSDSFSTRPGRREIQRRKLILHDLLCRELKAFGASNRSTFRNFVNWLGDRVAAGKFDSEKIWHRVAALAEDSLKGAVRNPRAVFIAKVKSELGYLKDG